MSDIKLIATDLDGTLLHTDKSMPKGFSDFVVSHPEVKVVISSGRQYANIRTLFPDIADKLTYIAENGGLVYDNGKALFVDAMNEDDVKEAIDTYIVPGESTVVLCGLKSAYMLRDSSEDSIRNASLYYTDFELIDSFDLVDDKILKVAIFIEGLKANTYFESHKEQTKANSRVNFILSGNSWIDIANATVNKGTGIKVLQDYFNISRDECMAFGDYLNDVSLLEACTESYAMENAHDELKKFAKHIAPSNDEEGVMKILNDIFK